MLSFLSIKVKINTHTDSLQSAIYKKSGNDELSNKTLKKLIKITKSEYNFKNGEA